MTKQAISHDELVTLANKMLQDHDDFIEAIEVREVHAQHGVLIFKGESFLDADSLPTAQSPLAFNLYKWLCHQLSDKYELV